jgi:hypothetical protein
MAVADALTLRAAVTVVVAVVSKINISLTWYVSRAMLRCLANQFICNNASASAGSGACHGSLVSLVAFAGLLLPWSLLAGLLLAWLSFAWLSFAWLSFACLDLRTVALLAPPQLIATDRRFARARRGPCGRTAPGHAGCSVLLAHGVPVSDAGAPVAAT